MSESAEEKKRALLSTATVCIVQIVCFSFFRNRVFGLVLDSGFFLLICICCMTLCGDMVEDHCRLIVGSGIVGPGVATVVAYVAHL
jgi:hypothetical protein